MVVLMALGIPAASHAQARGASPPQARALDAWKKVPATPTSCFRDDDFDARLNALGQELIADRERQEALNAKLLERFNNMDVNERMRRMQEMMMKDPQAAAKMIEASANAGIDAGTTTVDVANVALQMDKTLEGHQKAFDAATEEALKPLLAKEQVLIKTKTKLVGEAQVPQFVTAAGYAEYVAVIGEENAASERACAAYFGPQGRFHAWLAQYRTEVLDKNLASAAMQESAARQQIAMIETPDSRYQSVAAIDAARTFVGKLEKISQFRRRKAAPTIPPP